MCSRGLTFPSFFLFAIRRVSPNLLQVPEREIGRANLNSVHSLELNLLTSHRTGSKNLIFDAVSH